MSKVAVKESHTHKVLILGLDGATFDVIEPLAREGRIPNLATLMDEGSWGVLDSTLPPVTIPAWPCMMTGKNPGRLGFFDLLRREGYGVEPNSYCYANHAPLWQILNRYGITTGVMNLPGTYPPEDVDGFMVTGMLTPSKESAFTSPSKLGVDLGSMGIDYEIDVPQWQYFDEEVFIKDIHKVTKKRGQAAEYLIKRIPCDFYMVVFTSTDRLQHLLWDKREVIEQYWEELDQVIGRLLEVVGDETTIFVVSDHGFGPLERTFFVNEWLRRRGFLKARRKINERAMVKLGRFFEWLYRFLGKRDLLKPVVWFLNKSIGIEKLQKIAYSYLSNVRLEGRVNWRKTRAFSCVHTPHFGQIYLNKQGEMMEGCVSEMERDKLLESLMDELRDLVYPRTGERVKVEAHYSRDIYLGSHVREAPEIIFLLDDGRCEIDAKVGEERLFVEGSPLTGWKGTHTKNGVFIAKGPGVKSGFRVDNATVMDITPTLLRFYGVPLQADMDGRVIDEIFLEDFIFPERMEIGPSQEREGPQCLDAEEKALIEDRLKKLGYIS